MKVGESSEMSILHSVEITEIKFTLTWKIFRENNSLATSMHILN